MPERYSSAIWHVYLALCHDNTIYCGICLNPRKRLAQHNGRLGGGARYTRSRRPVSLSVIMSCRDHGSALREEKAIKSLPHRRKLDFFLAGERINAGY